MKRLIVQIFKMKKTFFIIILSFLISSKLENIPVIIEQPDGTVINCFASGDEYYSRLQDVEGYTINQSSVGYY